MGNICTEKCWTPVKCPEHGDTFDPFGRDGGLYEHTCCDLRFDVSVNPRHLWHEHDSTRWYTDPEGWNAHEATCKECNPND